MSPTSGPEHDNISGSRSDAELAAVTVGEVTPLNGTIHLALPDPEWPTLFSRLAARVRGALSQNVLLLEHVGSTSIPGLWAKPVIDMVLAVADSSDEAAYVPCLEQQGFRLRIREPDWFEHRLLQCIDTPSNLHVFTVECAEIGRMLAFRDWLRRHHEDRQLYEQTKLRLAAQTWRHLQDYADAKSDVTQQILRRALTSNHVIS